VWSSFGYSPAIYDLRQILPNGQYINNFMNGGGNGTSNPFADMAAITNNEDTWRQTGHVNAGYSLLATQHHSLQLSYLAGIDRFQDQTTQYSPNYLQFESADGFLGTSQVGTTNSNFFNQSLNAVHTWTPGIKWLNSAQTSFGGTYESQLQQAYAIESRGLLPTRDIVSPTSVNNTFTENISQFVDQSLYVNEQLLMLDEKLSVSAGVREDRSSANGNRANYYAFPKYSASYRFVKPFSTLTDKIDEVKFRAGIGQSGNRPPYGARDLTISSGAIIGGQGSLVANGGLGNPQIKPEVMNETEFGIDAAFWNQRIGIEATHYERVLKDLLLSDPLPLSSGLSSVQINGGQLSTRGFEGSLTIALISKRDLEWTFKTTFQANVQNVDKLPVPSFNAPGGSFGASYGRNRIVQGARPTLIWGNHQLSCIPAKCAVTPTLGADGKPCHYLPVGGAPAYVLQYGAGTTFTRDTILADANPRQTTQFNNTIRWKNWSLTALLDWRNGGYTADMTNNLYDEGGQSRDYDAKSPVAGTGLGAWRYGAWTGGNDARPYVQDGTYLKFREITITYTAPKALADLAKAREMRFSLQARNMAMLSNYWSFDPEFNNFGAQNYNRFIDLAPYPSMRQYFFSVDLGY
jgi:hypothetical protein